MLGRHTPDADTHTHTPDAETHTHTHPGRSAADESHDASTGRPRFCEALVLKESAEDQPGLTEDLPRGVKRIAK